MTSHDNTHQKTPFTDGFLSAFARGVQHGLGLAGDPCADSAACPTPPATATRADQRPIAGADDELTNAHERLQGDDLDGSDE